jgi:hypothetical protein
MLSCYHDIMITLSFYHVIMITLSWYHDNTLSYFFFPENFTHCFSSNHLPIGNEAGTPKKVTWVVVLSSTLSKVICVFSRDFILCKFSRRSEKYARNLHYTLSDDVTSMSETRVLEPHIVLSIGGQGTLPLLH